MTPPWGGSMATISAPVMGSPEEGVAGDRAPWGAGLPAREPEGVPRAFVPVLRWLPPSFCFFFILPPTPSDISPPVASPSLVEPGPGRRGKGVPLRLPASEDELGPVLAFFLRVDSVPLESETPGDPARFSDFPFLPELADFLPWGVLLSLDPAPSSFSFSFSLSLSLSLSFLSSSFLFSSSSVSVSDSLFPKG